MTTAAPSRQRGTALARLVWLSIAAAILTIALKTTAWALTGSVGLLSDAAESLVNLAAASFALIVVHWTNRPADEEHAYGHEKADYLSAGVEGALILIAAATIVYSSVGRLVDPARLQDVELGLAISVVASLINLAVGRVLIRRGREHRSLTLEADGKHLMTDVWTSAGVVAGILLVVVTGWERLDALVGLLVAANIVWTGVGLVRSSTSGLMDRALPDDEVLAVRRVLDDYADRGIRWHALRTRRAGARTFISVHLLVPGRWTVQRGHDLLEQVEADLRAIAEPATVFTHLEPLEDPLSFADTGLDRTAT